MARGLISHPPTPISASNNGATPGKSAGSHDSGCPAPRPPDPLAQDHGQLPGRNPDQINQDRDQVDGGLISHPSTPTSNNGATPGESAGSHDGGSSGPHLPNQPAQDRGQLPGGNYDQFNQDRHRAAEGLEPHPPTSSPAANNGVILSKYAGYHVGGSRGPHVPNQLAQNHGRLPGGNPNQFNQDRRQVAEGLISHPPAPTSATNDGVTTGEPAGYHDGGSLGPHLPNQLAQDRSRLPGGLAFIPQPEAPISTTEQCISDRSQPTYDEPSSPFPRDHHKFLGNSVGLTAAVMDGGDGNAPCEEYTPLRAHLRVGEHKDGQEFKDRITPGETPGGSRDRFRAPLATDIRD